jgi:hypothetical protein
LTPASIQAAAIAACLVLSLSRGIFANSYR